MKKHSLIILTLLITFSLNADELSWVDKQIEAIKPPREGVSNSVLSMIKTPFVFLNKKKQNAKSSPRKVYNKRTTKKRSKKRVLSRSSSLRFNLTTIINGSALINGKWYKLNDKVYNYKISNIRLTTVLLTNGKKKLLLSTTDTKRNLKFK